MSDADIEIIHYGRYKYGDQTILVTRDDRFCKFRVFFKRN